MTREGLDRLTEACEWVGYRKAILDVRTKLNELLDLTDECQDDMDIINEYLEIPEKLLVYMDSKIGELNE